MRTYHAASITALAWLLCASASGQVSGTVETYFQSDRLSHGFTHAFSWAEVNVRLNQNLKGTASLTQGTTRRTLDEANVQYESGQNMLRVGRFRAAFGFANWSDTFYTGFNKMPIVHLATLVDGTRVFRDDNGIELTTGGPKLQVQAALVDSKPSDYQVSVSRFRHASIRAQSFFGPVIAAIDALPSLTGQGSIYGADLRWTTPHVVARAEYMKGVNGVSTAQGYYADAAYRVPGLPRTQVIGRTEWFEPANRRAIRFHTLGAKHVVTQNLILNVNYGWGTGELPPYAYYLPLTGWSLRALFQVHF